MTHRDRNQLSHRVASDPTVFAFLGGWLTGTEPLQKKGFAPGLRPARLRSTGVPCQIRPGLKYGVFHTPQGRRRSNRCALAAVTPSCTIS
jgi:hypothetical protein